MALHCLAPHGILYVFGANDEGIKSAASALGSHFGAVSQLANAKRCRVYMGTAPNPQHSNAWDLPCLYADLSQHIPAANNILFYPGNFAAGRLDDGSALLLETLPNLATVRTALDYGCGAGILPLALQQHKPDITWYCLDIDRLALLATAHNTQHMQPAPHLIWNREIPAQMPSVDLIISNPPVHAGKADDYSIVQNLIHDAPRHLHATGQLAMVVHPHAPVEDLLKHAFKRVERAGRSKGYCVWHAAAPQR
jgi:16S rRNA (guanine1207-N2)-methyltransferase